MIRASAVVTLLCVCHSAIGHIVTMPAQTLSSQMQTADAVVRGKVLRFEQIVSACPGPGKSLCLRVTVKVSELVTGPKSDTIEIYETYNEPYFPDWVRNPNDQFWPTKSDWTPNPYPKAIPLSARFAGPIWQIPLWLLLVLLLVPQWVSLFKMLLRKAGTGPRGFPVMITPK